MSLLKNKWCAFHYFISHFSLAVCLREALVLSDFLELFFPEAETRHFSMCYPVWWLILCMNLSGPVWTAQAFGQLLFWVFLWGCFWMRLTFESLVWMKQIGLLKVGEWVLSNQLNIWIEQKGWARRNFFCLTALTWDISLFWLWVSKWTFSSWVSDLMARLELTPLTLLTIGLRASNLDQHCMLAILGLQPADCQSWDFSAS